MDFYKKLNEGLSLGKINRLCWDIYGEDLQFRPDRVIVRMEDTDGKVFELILHPSIPTWYQQERLILFMVLYTHGLWAGDVIWFDLDLATAVNGAKRDLVHEFQTNERECIRYPWIVPHVRF